MINCPVCRSCDTERKVQLIWCSTYYDISYECKNCGATFTPKMLFDQWRRKDYIGSLPITDQTIPKSLHITLSDIPNKKLKRNFKIEYHG